MRAPVNKDRAESRVVSRYHKLHIPPVELIQSLQDLVPQGMIMDSTIELTQVDGYLQISQTAKPIKLVINDGERQLTLVVKEVKQS